MRENGRIQDLPGTLENLTNLETIDLFSCALTEFPQVLCKVKSLKALNIGRNDTIKVLRGRELGRAPRGPVGAHAHKRAHSTWQQS